MPDSTRRRVPVDAAFLQAYTVGMLSPKGPTSRLVATIRGALLPALFNAQARSFRKGRIALETLLAPKAPPMPLFGFGHETKGPMRRHPMWPMNHYATKWAPTARHGAQECARRRRQIERGQLTEHNGLVIGQRA